MTIDAEVHFWKYSKALEAPLIRSQKKMQEDQLPGQVQLNFKRNGIDACVAVAAEPAEVETRFLAELMRTHPLVRGVIGRIDLSGADAAEKIDELAAYPEIRGYRVTAANGLPAAAVMQSLASHAQTLDVELAAGADIAAVTRWMNEYPEQSFLLSDCGNPDTKTPPSPQWQDTMRRLALAPNCSCKVSGLFTRAAWNQWRPAEFYPFLELLFTAFGPRRLLYASDWPFLLLSGSYVQWKSLLDKFTGHLSADDRDAFYGDNARRFYRLTGTDLPEDESAG